VDILRHLFCVDIEIPKDINVPVVDQKPNQTVRQSFLAHATDPKCTSCHAMIDPLGYAFEHYDAVAQWRDTDASQPVDSSGMAMIRSATFQFKNAVELSQQLAQSPDVRNCMANEWLRYFVRRHEGDGDAASLQSATASFTKAGFDLRQLIVSLTKTRAFTHRSPSVGEVF